MTNEHVLARERRNGALGVDDAVVRLRSHVPFQGAAQATFRVGEILWSDVTLDATIARINPMPGGLPPSPPRPVPLPARDARARVYVIGHPGGRTLTFVAQRQPA